MTDCTCGSIGRTDGLRLCTVHHAYWLNDRELVSVSKVIRTVFPTDYSAVPPGILENARVRGERVDRYFSNYLNTGHIRIEAGERSDVVERLTLLINWWDKSGLTAQTVQKPVYSERDGVAGTMDVRTAGVLDVKVVSALQPSYALQLGAYADMDNADEAGIIHVTAKECRFIPYDVNQCKAWWRQGCEWWKEMQRINATKVR